MKYRTFFSNSLLFTVIFPNIRAVSAANSFQPLTLPVILLDAVVTGRFNRFATYFIGVYLVCVLASLALHTSISATWVLYCVLYLSGPLTFFYFLGRDGALSAKLINVGFVITFVTVVEQFFVRSPVVESILSIVFANRPPEVSVGLRGVGGFMSEPSQSGRLYFFLLFLAFLTRTPQRGVWLALAIPFLLMNRSASAFLYLLVLLASLSYRRSPTLTAILMVLAAIAFPYFLLLEYRFVDVFERVAQAWEMRSADSIVTVLGMAGGRRLIQTSVGFASLAHYPVGHGIGSSLETFVQTARDMGFNLAEFRRYEELEDGLKPSSYASQLVYDLGWLSLPIFVALALPLHKFRLSPDPLRKGMFFLGVAQIVLASPTTIPWPWVMMALGLVRPKDGLDDPSCLMPRVETSATVQEAGRP